MANFKVGQRVKLIRYDRRLGWFPAVPIGAEGHVVDSYDCGYGVGYRVVFDGFDCRHFCFPEEIAPLTDPDAKQFVRDVTQPNPGILRERETVKVLK